MMSSIVLSIDFSESTDQLVLAASNFAKKINAKIYLIHVASTDLGFSIGDMGYQYFPEVEQNEIKAELKHLSELEQKIKTNGLECEHLLKQGTAGETIIDFAILKKADYIVIGSHGRSGLYDVFVGSLTKEITKNSPIPVLVIPCHKPQ